MKLFHYRSPLALASSSLAPRSVVRVEDPFAPLFSSLWEDAADRTSPLAVELTEEKERYLVEAAVPGVKREGVTLEVADGVLVLSVERARRGAAGEAKHTFSRTIALPSDVQENKITARLEDGLLTIELPKAEAVKPRRIELS